MTISILLAALCGISLVVLLTWYFGGFSPAQLGDDAWIRSRLSDDEPQFKAGDILVSRERDNALVATSDDDGLALVSALGDKAVTRLLQPGWVRSWRMVRNGSEHVLALETSDFTFPDVQLVLPAQTDVRTWQDKLSRICASRQEGMPHDPA